MNTLVSILILLCAVLFAVFHGYPPPPQSPILYQWHAGDSASYFIVDGYDIFFKDVTGDHKGGEVLLCLHGFPTSSFDFYLVLPYLRRVFSRVILLDFLGFGYSDKPRFHSYSIFEQANITEALIGMLKVKGLHILAHDYGDTVAQELLARQNEGSLSFTIRTLCLLNGGIFPSHHRPTWAQKVLRTPLIGVMASRLMNHLVFRIGLSDVFGPNTKPTAADISNYWHLARHKEGYRMFGTLLSYIGERFENEERWVGALRKSSVPVHMIYGPADPVNPPPFDDHYRRIMPQPSIHVLPKEVGHYVHLEAPQDMMAAYLRFLEKNNIDTKSISVNLIKTVM